MSKWEKLGAVVVGAVALGVVGYVGATSYWRPVAPGVTIDAKGREALGDSNQLLFIYGERGLDPMHRGAMTADERISGCVFHSETCVSGHARYELRVDGPRKQSLQISRINGEGNPIVATVVWTGPAYPAEVKLTCDFRNPRVDQACTKVG